MIKRIEKVIKLIDKTPDISSLGSDRLEYFQWSTNELIKLIKKQPATDCGRRTNTTLIKPEDQCFSSAEKAWELYSFHYYMPEFTQALINQGEWNLLPNILSPSHWKVFEDEYKNSMFQYLPDDQKIKTRASWSLENIIEYPTVWNWGIKFFIKGGKE